MTYPPSGRSHLPFSCCTPGAVAAMEPAEGLAVAGVDGAVGGVSACSARHHPKPRGAPIATANRTMAATAALRAPARGVVALPRRVFLRCLLMLSHLLWFALDPCSPVPGLIVPSHQPMAGTQWRTLTGGTPPALAPDHPCAPAPGLPPAGSWGIRLVLHVGQHPDHAGRAIPAPADGSVPPDRRPDARPDRHSGTAPPWVGGETAPQRPDCSGATVGMGP